MNRFTKTILYILMLSHTALSVGKSHNEPSEPGTPPPDRPNHQLSLKAEEALTLAFEGLEVPDELLNEIRALLPNRNSDQNPQSYR